MTTCFEKELFIRLSVCVLRGRFSVCETASFPFGFEGGMWDWIVLVPDHYLRFTYFICTLKRNRNATPFQWKIHWALFKVLDGDNEPSNFQEMLTNSTKLCLKLLPIKTKCFPGSITSE